MKGFLPSAQLFAVSRLVEYFRHLVHVEPNYRLLVGLGRIDLCHDIVVELFFFVKILKQRAQRRHLALLGVLAARVLFAVERIRRQVVDKRFYIGGRELGEVGQRQLDYLLAPEPFFYQVVAKNSDVAQISESCKRHCSHGYANVELARKVGETIQQFVDCGERFFVSFVEVIAHVINLAHSVPI